MSALHLGGMKFFAEYSALSCGKEKEREAFSSPHSAVSIQPNPFTAKDAKNAKNAREAREELQFFAPFASVAVQFFG
jgi:hypothetical protein